MSAFLTACATHSPVRPNADAFLQPTVIEGKHKSMEELMADPKSTNRDLIDFGGNAQDAKDRCNADKESVRSLIKEVPL